MQQHFPPGFTNRLLTAEHYHRLGIAIFVYGWLTDRVTEEYQHRSGEVRGKVHGGRVISAVEIAEHYGLSEATVRSHLKTLYLAGYIDRRQAKTGYSIEIRNSEKWGSWRARAPDASGSSDSQSSRIQDSKSSRLQTSCNPSTLEVSNPSDLQLLNPREPSNKTLQSDPDIAKDTPPAAEETPAGEAADRWTQAAGMASRGKPPGYREAVERCRPLRIEGDAVVVELPDNQVDRIRIEAMMLALRNALRMNTDRPLALVMVDPNTEARAGPSEVVTDADGAADPQS